MNLLIDIAHPAHIHYYKNLYSILKGKHHIVFTCKDVPIIKALFDSCKIPYNILGSKGRSISGKMLRLGHYTYALRKMIIKKNIDIAFGVQTIHSVWGKKARTVVFCDDDQAAINMASRFILPFADTIISPEALKFESHKKAIYYPGFHELAYLHPKRFTPDAGVLSTYGLDRNDAYFILRFNAFTAYHDIHEGGMSLAQKRELIKLLRNYGKIFITTEARLDAEFEQFRLPVAPHELHDLLAFASLLVSDSQTMSSEAAMLGVPSFRCNSFAGRLSCLEEEEKRFGLTFGFLPHQFEWMMSRIKSLLDSGNYLKEFLAKRDKMLLEKIDVIAFWAWFIDNYPESKGISVSKGFDFNEFR